MRAKDVIVGGIYTAKVSGAVREVRILCLAAGGMGWIAQNLLTGRRVGIRTARRLRARAFDWSDTGFQLVGSVPPTPCFGDRITAGGNLDGCDRSAVAYETATARTWCLAHAAERQHALLREAREMES